MGKGSVWVPVILEHCLGECFSRVISQTVNALSLSEAPLLNRKGNCTAKTLRKPAATDWERVQREATQELPIAHAAADGPYGPNDAAAVNAFWQRASITRGRGRPAVAVKSPTLNMRMDADVLEAFKATGQGWQTRINAAVREAVAHGLTKA